ncbi:MAG: lytic transglycosylase domain-containing protein [Cyclobacteriaceae bacterium]|nr:lytic transglycosylase domain-containing protein [Cyclobacteriaceae bacterium]
MKRDYFLVFIIVLMIAGYIITAQFQSKKPDAEDAEGHADERIVESAAVKSDYAHIILQEFPDSVTFAGESISLVDPDLAERYDREIILNTHFHSNTILLIKKSHRWFPLIEPILLKYGIPDDFKYLTLVEGGLSNDVSPRGAVGFWQLLPSTARELGLEVNSEVDERYNPIRSTEAACKYILKAKEKFGTWTNAAASYNVGMRGLARSMESQKTVSYYDLLLNEETSRYIFRIIALKQIFEDPGSYGFQIGMDQLYMAEPVDSVFITSSIRDLTDFAFSKGINYKILKRHNPWLRKNTLTVKRTNRAYVIVIPRWHLSSIQADIAISDSTMIGEDRFMEENGD